MADMLLRHGGTEDSARLATFIEEAYAEVDRLRTQLAAETARAKEAERERDCFRTLDEARGFALNDAIERAERAEKACVELREAARAFRDDEDEDRTGTTEALYLAIDATPAQLATAYDARVMRVAEAVHRAVLEGHYGCEGSGPLSSEEIAAIVRDTK